MLFSHRYRYRAQPDHRRRSHTANSEVNRHVDPNEHCNIAFWTREFGLVWRRRNDDPLDSQSVRTRCSADTDSDGY